MTKKIVTKTINAHHLNGLTLKQLQVAIYDLTQQCGEDAVFDVFGYEFDMEISYKREETEKEYVERVAQELQQKVYRRQQYEALKKEFENE